MADQTAGGERQDYRELGLQTAEDVGDDMNVKVGTPTEEPVERKTAKDLSRGEIGKGFTKFDQPGPYGTTVKR